MAMKRSFLMCLKTTGKGRRMAVGDGVTVHSWEWNPEARRTH